MGRKQINRNAIFALLSLNWNKKQIKKETGISERTYWRISSDYDALPQAEKDRIRRTATKEEDAKASFEEYPIVQKWIQTMQGEKVKCWKAHFNDCKRVWLILQKKNPENWTVDDIKLRAIPELRKHRKSIYDFLVSIRSLRPDFKPKISTKREKPPINYAWKKHFEKLMENNGALLKVYLETGDLEARTAKYAHVTLGCREGRKNYAEWQIGRLKEEELIGGLLGLRWEKVSWEKKTIDIYESKTGGGFYWLDCPLDLFGDTAFNLLQQYWESKGKPSHGRIFAIDVDRLVEIYNETSQVIGFEVHPHFARKLHASLCREQDIPIEIVAGDAPHGLVGCGWEDLTTLKKFYLAFSIAKIDEAKQKCKTLQI